jgi:hypothetical protein
MAKLSNIELKEFQKFLIFCGCKKIGTNGGHEKWSKLNMIRPIILQTHISPIPVFIIKNNLKTLGLSEKDLLDFLDK